MKPRLKRPKAGLRAQRDSAQPVDELKFTLPLPPSANALYQRRRGGGLALSSRAKRFKEDVKEEVTRHLSTIMRFPIDDEFVYEMTTTLYFESLENPGWFERWEKDSYVTRGKNKGKCKGRKGERKAKTRYKIIDYDNRIKFLQDCVIEGIGISNDAQVFRGISEKREDPEEPRAEVKLRPVNRNDFFPERR